MGQKLARESFHLSVDLLKNHVVTLDTVQDFLDERDLAKEAPVDLEEFFVGQVASFATVLEFKLIEPLRIATRPMPPVAVISLADEFTDLSGDLRRHVFHVFKRPFHLLVRLHFELLSRVNQVLNQAALYLEFDDVTVKVPCLDL